MRLSSKAFQNNQEIPIEYTCDGENTNPPLQFFDIPLAAQTLALIVDDPDAPRGDWVHWLIWNISPQTTEIANNSFPDEAVLGTTDFDKPGYGGPCPPSGNHHYHFKLYALDQKIDLPSTARKRDLEQAMKGHILDTSQLIGIYQR